MLCFFKIGILGIENIRNPLLWIPVNNGEPGTLDLNHDPVAFSEPMVNFMKSYYKFLRFVRD